MVKKALSKLGNQLSEEEFFLGSDVSTPATDWMSDDSAGELAVDVYETATDIVIKAPIAGVSPEDIDITASPDMVTIKGERKEEKEIDSGNYIARECFWGSFARSVSLPSEGEVDKAKVSFKDGILSLRIPKSKKNQSVKLKVSS